MNGVLLFHKTLNGKSKDQILNLAMNCYAHVISGAKTFQEWAQKIKEVYDLSDPRNKVIYETVNNIEGTIENYPYVGKTIMRHKKV